MQWLNKVADEVIARFPEGEILVSSGVSPSGVYHVGTLREVLTADAIMLALRDRGRDSRHIHVVDDLDPLRKIPAGVPAEFEKYFGMSLIDVPAPDGQAVSWADYYFQDFEKSAKKLGLEMEIMRSHEKYQAGFMTPAIEKVLTNIDKVRSVITSVSGRQLDETWSPIQIKEDNYLKKRKFLSIDTDKKTLEYEDKDGAKQETSYAKGEVKLDWRLDWPARWWLLGVDVEPFGRDHASAGSSYDTGKALVKEIFEAEAPFPVPFNNINRTGQTKKMSKSTGDTLAISDMLQIVPPEALRYFVLRFAPDKLLFFDETAGLIKLIDDFSALLAAQDQSKEDEQTIKIAMGNVPQTTISNIPFSHLVASYQAALKDSDKTLEIIGRTEHKKISSAQEETIKNELKFIDNWLQKWAPEDVKFELAEKVDAGQFTDEEKAFLSQLADKIAGAPEDADGEWFHKAIYDIKESAGMTPQQVFKPLYQALIGKDSGPRAGWFLSLLPRDWLIKRLRLES